MPEQSRTRRSFQGVYVLMLLALVLFAVRNLPWHLDNYDQARQAYAALDVVQNGHLLFQELPYGGFATKPPLTAWLQAGLALVPGVSWDVAWRLPPYLVSAAMLLLLYHRGMRLGGMLGALLAVAAFAFNMMTVRIATLVRTDMLLALFCFLPGLQILDHIEQERAWTRREVLCFFLLILAAVFTKAHTVYAFLLPGLILYAVIQRRRRVAIHAWPGLVPLLLPLLMLVSAIAWAVWRYPGFNEQIIEGEVLYAFQGSSNGDNSPLVFYYVAHLFHRWAPWSLLALLLAVVQGKRLAAYWKQPVFVWLVCWTLGGLLAMSLIPDKRSDRIFPLLAPFSLLLVYLASHYDRARLFGMNYRRFLVGVLSIGVCIWTVYGLAQTGNDLRKQTHALRLFSQRIQPQFPQDRIGLVGPSAEGFLCYFRETDSLTVPEAVEAWRAGQLDAVLISQSVLSENEGKFAPYAVLELVRDPFNDESYACLVPSSASDRTAP